MNNRQGIMSNRHGAMPRQKGENFSVIFVPDYLVVPNNLLTHTHTHTHTHSHLASNYTFFTFAYAREKRVVTPINKGLQGVPFVRFFVPFCQAAQERNNNGFIETF